MIAYSKELNKEQLAVVEKGDGPCLVLAGAGSGKTRTITYRVAYLLEQGIDPDNILLVTFTNKAAREMKNRIARLVDGKKLPSWSGTFHHIAYRILRKWAPVLGYENNFTILDSEDSRDLLKLCVKAEGIDSSSKRFPSVRVVQSILSYARNAETTIADVLDQKHEHWMQFEHQFVAIAEEYRKRKLDANAMDFDDLLVNLYLLLLKSEKVRKNYAEQFEYILVDEYQDTNKVQASIIDRLASVHKNVLVVGDDAQSIYSFRAADIQNILAFEKKHKGAQVFRLETNYRSTPDILDVANEVIAQNIDQYDKNLKTDFDAFTKPELHAFVDKQGEAAFIAERISELCDEGVKLSSIAVLFRAAFHSQALEVELTRRGIPYDFRGGVRFFERAHIKDVLAFLRVLANQNDTIAWSRVLTMQVGIGPAGANKIIALVRSGTAFSEIGAKLPARAQVGWSDFLQIFDELQKVEKVPHILITTILETKYVEYLEMEYENFQDRMQDIEQLALFAERQDDLARFLAEASMQESYAAALEQGHVEEGERMVLSTIHQAKGLEWEVVFIMNLASGQFPIDKAKGSQAIEEERRLFYVAITRARKYLYLSYPLTTKFSSVLLGPSMFIGEIGIDLLSRHTISTEGDSVFNDPSDDVDDIVYVPVDEPFADRSFKRTFLKSIDEL